MKNLKQAITLCSVAMGLSLPHTVFSQTADTPTLTTLEEVVVTARRRDERLSDVPISIAVMNQAELQNLNIVNASDIALYTPGLTANTRFGDDSSSFAIRGFTQEMRTTPSVGVYFAEVVAPRGGGSTTAGDGAGPGAYFDLENVQVLKGPQGTLFGRNTTGGAVLLVPKKPTDTLEGYVEGSVGNYDMRRLQGVVNIPMSDRVRLRLGVDQQKRDGYFRNTSGVGPGDLSDMDYISARASLSVDLTDRLENYTILTYVDSENNGTLNKLQGCNPDGGGFAAFFGPFCASQMAREDGGYYDMTSLHPKPENTIEQWQAINTTTWQLSDHLTLKNIISYAELETTMASSVFGFDFRGPTFPGQTPTAPPTGMTPVQFNATFVRDGVPANHQSTFVEELQLQGTSLDDRLTWQTGIYYERSKPKEPSGTMSITRLACDLDTLVAGDPLQARCADYIQGMGFPIPGALVSQVGEVEYENKAVYAQATYEFNDQWSVTGGIRYTWDESRGKSQQLAYRFPASIETGAGPFAPLPGTDCGNPDGTPANDCWVRMNQKSEEPTWLIGVDYTPWDDALLYAKYMRGYRQGSVNIFGVAGLNVYGPEQVDTFELGGKFGFGESYRGSFNAAMFYNDFKDQQIQQGLFPVTGTPTTGIFNAGSSTIWGVEFDTSLEFQNGVSIKAAYTYLNTEVDELDSPQVPPGQLIAPPSMTTAEGEPLPASPEHQLAITLGYHLPVDEALGDISVSASYIYTAEQQMVAKFVSPYYKLPSYEIVNLNLNWAHVGGSPFDLSLFVTNALDEEYSVYTSGNYSSGFETHQLGQPRMYGARLRYNF